MALPSTTLKTPAASTMRLLSKYRLFLQLNYPPYRWEPAAMAAFRKYIEEGRGGWIGFHHATLLGEFDGYPMWPWFSEFMGGIRFASYIPTFATGTVKVEVPGHPAMRGVDSSFRIENEEWYTYDRSPRPNVRVLASVEEKSYVPAQFHPDGRPPGDLEQRADEGPQRVYPDGASWRTVSEPRLRAGSCTTRFSGRQANDARAIFGCPGGRAAGVAGDAGPTEADPRTGILVSECGGRSCGVRPRSAGILSPHRGGARNPV